MMNNWILGILLAAILMLGIVGCGTNQRDNQNNGPGQANWDDYEDKLQRSLFDVAISDDPAVTADKLNVEDRHMLQVVIELAPDATLPVGYLILVELESDGIFQAWVPVDELLDLAQEEAILYIRAPARPNLR